LGFNTVEDHLKKRQLGLNFVEEHLKDYNWGSTNVEQRIVVILLLPGRYMKYSYKNP
jgi:hypothetical protein